MTTDTHSGGMKSTIAETLGSGFDYKQRFRGVNSGLGRQSWGGTRRCANILGLLFEHLQNKASSQPDDLEVVG